MTLPPAYSKRFLQGRNKSVGSNYIVPEGKVGVVKCCSGLLHSLEVEGCGWALIGPTGETVWQAAYTLKNEEAQIMGEAFLWYGQAVFYEGEVIGCAVIAGNVDYYVSGFLLASE